MLLASTATTETPLAYDRAQSPSAVPPHSSSGLPPKMLGLGKELSSSWALDSGSPSLGRCRLKAQLGSV